MTGCLPTSLIYCSYGTVSNSKTIKNSRLVSQKDDVHVCIMCLRAIMNYQVPNDTPHEQNRSGLQIDGVLNICSGFSHRILFSLSHPLFLHAVWLQYGDVSCTRSQ